MVVGNLPNIFGNFNTAFGVEAFIVLFVIFYIVFALILYRQIQLMTKSLPTMLTPFLKFGAILQIGVSIALLFIIIGLF